MKTKQKIVYAIQLDAKELTETNKIKNFKRIVERIGYSGVNPKYPYCYALFDTRQKQIQAYDELSSIFNHCKVVKNEGYIDAK